MLSIRDCLFPIKTAYTGVACANCMKEIPAVSAAVNAVASHEGLLKCSQCKRAHYCSKECQRIDWKIHKPECQLLQKIETKYYADLPGSTPYEKAYLLDRMIGAMISSGDVMPSVEDNLPRHQLFLQMTRVCSVCHKSEYDLSQDNKNRSSYSRVVDWVCCPRCTFGWCCSRRHWDEYQSTQQHTDEICDTYRQSIACDKFCWNHTQKYNEIFFFAPDTVWDDIQKFFPKSWEEYFQVRAAQETEWAKQGRLPAMFLPAATAFLTLPVTTLHGMYEFGIGAFQDLTTITIHVVGASPELELSVPSMLWEEVMHCLPRVKHLHIVFIDPKIQDIPGLDGNESDFQCCKNCYPRGRTLKRKMVGKLYHVFQKSSGFSRPDIVVAFNTGMYEVGTEGWKETVNVLLDMNVPAVFTSFCNEEAVQDIEVLRSLDANLLNRRPVFNPFRSLGAQIEACGRDDFYHTNMYYSAFRGRVAVGSQNDFQLNSA